MRTIRKKRRITMLFLVLVSASFFICMLSSGCETRRSLTKKRIKSVEKSLLEAVSIKGMPLKKMNIRDRMQYYRVPGLSVAVIDNDRIEWSKEYGSKNALASNFDPVTQNTLFQAGDLSQPVSAAGVIYEAEKKKLDLDTDVNHYLKSIKIPKNRFTRKEPVTLRHLLSHSSGLSLAALPGFTSDEEPLSVVQLLHGEAGSKYPPLHIAFKPGSQVRLSQGGYALLQVLLADMEGKPFSAFMYKHVLQPLGLEHSTFAYPLPAPLQAEAASGHLRDGKPLEGGSLFYPASAASGLWTTPVDLANFGLNLIHTAKGETGGVISPRTARIMLTPQVGSQGFGVSIDDTGDNINFNKSGATKGFCSYMILYPQKGQGAVLMANSDNGRFLIDEVLRSLALTYGWPHFQPQDRPLYRLDPQVYQAYVGRYEINPSYILTVTYEDYYLIVQPTGQAPTKFYVQNPSTFFSTSPYIQIVFHTDAKGRATGLTLTQAGQMQEARRID